MKNRTAFIDTKPFWGFDYGPSHPLKMWRLKLTQKLQTFYRLLPEQTSPDDSNGLSTAYLIEPKTASVNDVLTFHEADYLEALHSADDGIWSPKLTRYGIGSSDCPIMKGIYSASMLAAGASVEGARKISNEQFDIAFNMAGGLHHAMPNYASGFCYINDPVVAIYKLLQKFDLIAYIDIDAHHGDGVQFAFYDNPKVLTISTHENGYYLFPGTGFESEMGQGKGLGFAINIPFLPKAGDDVYLQAFDEIVQPAIEAFKPKVIVTQLGADALSGDPITHWNLTTHSYLHALQTFKTLNLPWLALGGGGYNISNVCRVWTLALSVMLVVDLTDELPPQWQAEAKQYGIQLFSLKDKHPTISPPAVKADTDRVIKYLKQHHPLLALTR